MKSRQAGANDCDHFDAIHPGTSQKVAVSGSSTQSAALGANTTIVRVTSDTDCYLAFGSNPTALSDGTSLFFPAGVIEYFGVDKGSKIAVIQKSASGNLYIAEGA